MRLIVLKELVAAIYYKTPADARPDTPLVEVPEGIDFDPATMIEQKLVYRDMIRQLVKFSSTRDGMDNDELEKAINILKALRETKGDQLVLDDGDFSLLDARVKAARWPVATEAAVQFKADLIHAPAMSQERIDKLLALEGAETIGEKVDPPDSADAKVSAHAAGRRNTTKLRVVAPAAAGPNGSH